MKKSKSGWMISVTAGEIREQCKGRTDAEGELMVRSVEGFPDDFSVTVKKSAFDGPPKKSEVKATNTDYK